MTFFYIYRITNTVNGKTYIGQKSYKNSFENDNYWGSGKLIKLAIKKYGIENFKKEVLYSRVLSRKTADSMEIYAISKERKLGHSEYNIANGGTGWEGGMPLSIRTQISKTLKEHGIPETCKDNLRALAKARIGTHRSDETKLKIRQSLLGKEFSDIRKDNISKGKSTGKVICLETGKVYNSAGATKISGVMKVIKGERHTAGGYHWAWYKEDN